MSIYSVFLDKDQYYDQNIKLGSYNINNIADIIKMYLDLSSDIDSIYIAGGCYGRKQKGIEDLIESCFGNGSLKKYKISLMRKYKGFSFSPTDKAIKKYHHYLGVKFNTGRSDHRKMMFFLVKDKVVAVLIGSSNFSPSTYLKKHSSEADLLLIDYQFNGYYVNTNIVELLEGQFSNDNINNKNNLNNNFIVSKSLHGTNLLQEIFNCIKNKTVEVELDL